ncbi:Olfactory receptor, insect [Cinara cedri]|uniref:Odorant receptor n=1 Tax=Cinara cedri TaxID=506608 RepID=A0A5E4M389_9HEMI|nr:Olfactory receptor, insect [Cinara cedri]
MNTVLFCRRPSEVRVRIPTHDPFTVMAATANKSKNYDRDGTVVDVKLFKAIGLFQILSAGGRWHRTALQIGLCTYFGSIILNVACLYLASNDFQRLTYLSLLIIIAAMYALKAYVLLVNADRLWAVLDLARYAFTSCGQRDPSRLSRCRTALSTLLHALVVINYGAAVVWLVSPFFVQDKRLSVTHLDRDVKEYRIGIFNLWVPMSNAAYNSPVGWSLVYAYEAFILFFNCTVWSLFDCYLLTACFSLNAQFHTLTAGYAALGWRSPLRDTTDTPRHGDDRYRDLISLIKDNQQIVKKHDDFHHAVQVVVILQIANCSVTGVLAIFFIALMFMSGWSLMSPLVLKIIGTYVVVEIQLGIYCYAFSYVEIAKSAVNFGLYSSNWTEMNLKFKKTILTAMNMNICHKRITKLTPTTVINLELICRVIKTSYSIVSLLLNTTVEKTIK